MIVEVPPAPAGRTGYVRDERVGRPPSLHFWRVKRRRDLVADVRGTGPVVVLLHGQPGSARDWGLVAGDLARDHRVIVPDRLGYGLTGGPAGGFAANANAVARLLRSLGVAGAVIVGHSWAGGVALELSLDYPGSVAGLVLVSSVAPGSPPGASDRLLAVPLVGTVLAATALSTAGGVLSWADPRLRRLADAGPLRGAAGRAHPFVAETRHLDELRRRTARSGPRAAGDGAPARSHLSPRHRVGGQHGPGRPSYRGSPPGRRDPRGQSRDGRGRWSPVASAPTRDGRIGHPTADRPDLTTRRRAPVEAGPGDGLSFDRGGQYPGGVDEGHVCEGLGEVADQPA